MRGVEKSDTLLLRLLQGLSEGQSHSINVKVSWKMIMRRTSIILVVISFLILPVSLLAAGDPFSGVWKLNLSKSTLPPPAPKSQRVHIKAGSGGIEIREEIDNQQGGPTAVSVKAKFDGKEYPVDGSPFADSVIYERADRYTIKGLAKKAGKVVSRETVILSKDGKTMTVTYTGSDPAGKAVTATAVFERAAKE